MIDLSKYTYMVRHNPNCPKPFEVRTSGGAFTVDPKERRNLATYGNTLDEAMRLMSLAVEAHEASRRREYEEQSRRRDTEIAERRHRGIVWA